MSGPDPEARRGFTLAELIIVVVCIGLLGGLAVGGFVNLMQVGREEAAAGRARLVNAARCSYGLTVADAQERWAACGSDRERFGLLSSAQLLEGTPAEYLSSPGGYTLVLEGGLRERTRLLRNGESVDYR